jgi:hypothetical protein
LSELLLLEELGCCALAGRIDAPKNNEAARHREKSAGGQRDDFAGEHTINSTLP